MGDAERRPMQASEETNISPAAQQEPELLLIGQGYSRDFIHVHLVRSVLYCYKELFFWAINRLLGNSAIDLHITFVKIE